MTTLIDCDFDGGDINLGNWLNKSSSSPPPPPPEQNAPNTESIPVQIEKEETPLIDLNESFDPLKHQRVELVKKDVTTTKQIHIRRQSPISISPIDFNHQKSTPNSPMFDHEVPWRSSLKYPESPLNGTYESIKNSKPKWSDIELDNSIPRRYENHSTQTPLRVKVDSSAIFDDGIDVLKHRDFSTQTFGQLQMVNHSNVQTQTAEFALIKEYKPIKNDFVAEEEKKRFEKVRKGKPEREQVSIPPTDRSKKQMMKFMLSQIRDLKSQMNEIDPEISKESRKRKEKKGTPKTNYRTAPRPPPLPLKELEENQDIYERRRLDLLNKNPAYQNPPVYNKPLSTYRSQFRPHFAVPPPPNQQNMNYIANGRGAFRSLNQTNHQAPPVIYISPQNTNQRPNVPQVLVIASPPRKQDDDCSSCTSCSCSRR